MQTSMMIIAALVSVAASQAVSGSSGTVNVVDGVTVQGNGAAVVNGAFTPGNSIGGSVAANGDGKAVVDGFGDVNVRGAVQAAGHADATGAQVQAAINGEASGPYGLNARGAAAGSAFVDANSGTAGVAGAVNGEAGVLGNQVRGAASGTASGDLSGAFKVAGAANGCLKRADGRTDCYTNAGVYLGTINADGTYSAASTAATDAAAAAQSGSSSIVTGVVSFAGAVAALFV